jgi:hypothetical protein
MFLGAWIVALVINGSVLLSTWLRIVDQNESGLPIETRSSWQLFGLPPFPWTILAEHRQRYPLSRVRLWAILSSLIECALIFAPLLASAFLDVQ